MARQLPKARRNTLRAYSPAMRAERLAYLERQPWLTPYGTAERDYLRKLKGKT